MGLRVITVAGWWMWVITKSGPALLAAKIHIVSKSEMTARSPIAAFKREIESAFIRDNCEGLIAFHVFSSFEPLLRCQVTDCTHVSLTIILRLRGAHSALITSHTSAAAPVLQAVPKFPIERQEGGRRSSTEF